MSFRNGIVIVVLRDEDVLKMISTPQRIMITIISYPN